MEWLSCRERIDTNANFGLDVGSGHFYSFGFCILMCSLRLAIWNAFLKVNRVKIDLLPGQYVHIYNLLSGIKKTL